jgi:outer membrane lipoprotein-sorting protein
MRRLLTETLLVLLLTGCAVMEEMGPPTALTLEEVRHHIGINSLKATTLKAKVEVTIDSPELQSPLSCQGYIRLQRPGKLRIVCSKLFNTLFDVVSDGKEFRLYVPGEKRLYTGRADQRLAYLGLNFSPDDVAGLLDLEAVLSSRRLLFEPTPEHWEVHVLDERGLSHTDLLVDKKTLQVSYLESFNPDGSLKMQATLGEYRTIKGCRLPHSLEVYWPAGDTHLVLNLDRVGINEALDPRAFQLSTPKGVETVRVTDGAIGPKAVSQ